MEKSGYNALANWLVETMGVVGALIAFLLLMTALGVVGWALLQVLARVMNRLAYGSWKLDP